MQGEDANKDFTASPWAGLVKTGEHLGDLMQVATDRSWPLEAGEAATSRAKRSFDLVMASSLILLLAPALLLIGTAIFLESGGPIFFRQSRGGLGGRLFTILKFRTMLPADGQGGWTQRGDARVTRLGGFLRRTSLDELPQLFNVVMGDMSLVGPRPHAAEMDTEYAALILEYPERLRVRPGITGLAQVSDLRGTVGHVDDMRQRVAADARYIESWSLGLDLFILARTIPHLVAAGNAF
ncbi:MAG: pssZ [Phenylobacterium sp.]|nr:pssZ [Phenylobacterium sp.]